MIIPPTGPVTGLEMPRFAVLRSDTVNMRQGPGTSWPIEWTFQRRDLPVMIIGEFQLWRRIRDPDGAEGWVHSATLVGRRNALVKGADRAEIPLRQRPEEGAPPAALLRPGVIARIRSCEADSAWCQIQAGPHRGWLQRTEFWGALEKEKVE